MATIDIESLQNRLLKVCYVPATSAGLPRVSFFFSFFLLLRPLTVLLLMKQTRQVVCAVKQSIFFDVCDDNWQFLFYLQNRLIQTSQTGDQLYCDTSPLVLPVLPLCCSLRSSRKSSWPIRCDRATFSPRGQSHKTFFIVTYLWAN